MYGEQLVNNLILLWIAITLNVLALCVLDYCFAVGVSGTVWNANDNPIHCVTKVDPRANNAYGYLNRVPSYPALHSLHIDRSRSTGRAYRPVLSRA